MPDLPPITPESQKIPYYQATTFNSGMLSAAGLVQVDTACNKFGSAGVTCGPSDEELFATGMNGDEDLGEDITMKGDKFHFNQNLVQADPEAPQTTPNGFKRLPDWPKYDTKGYGPVEKESFFDPKIAKAHTTFFAQADPEAPQETPNGFKRLDSWAKYSTKGYGPVEKESFFDPKIAKAHTTFYAQADPEAPQTTTAGGKRGDNWAPYDTKGYGPVEKLSFFDPKVAKAHTSFYNKH